MQQKKRQQHNTSKVLQAHIFWTIFCSFAWFWLGITIPCITSMIHRQNFNSKEVPDQETKMLHSKISNRGEIKHKPFSHTKASVTIWSIWDLRFKMTFEIFGTDKKCPPMDVFVHHILWCLLDNLFVERRKSGSGAGLTLNWSESLDWD